MKRVSYFKKNNYMFLFFRNLKLVVLSSLIHHIANFEVLYPRSETETKIRIRKKGFLEADDVKKLHQKLYQKLNTYGAISFLMFENTPEKTETVCEVKYFSLTHAFLAMIMTNGEIVTDNVLSCELHRKEKQDNILQAVKTYETLILGKNFPW